MEATQLARKILLGGDNGVPTFADISLVRIPLFGFTAPSHANFWFDV